MADQCEVIEEQGHLSDLLNPTYIAVLNEVGVHSDVVTGWRSYTFNEVLTGLDTLSYVRSDIIMERGRLANVITMLGQPFYVVNDRGRVSDALFSARSYSISEVGIGADTLTPFRSVLIAELGRVLDTLTPLAHPDLLIAEHGTLADTLSYARSTTILEHGILADTLLSLRSALLAEVGSLADALFTGGLKSASLFEVGVLTDVLTSLLHARMTIAEEGFVDGDAIPPGQGGGWSASTDSWGMSRYTNQPFNSIAKIDGVLYGATDAGLFLIDGNTDAGTPIDAGIDMGITDMGSPAIKSLGYAYMGTITNGRMIFQANSAQFAQKVTYSYLFEDRNDGSGFGATRAKPGRGVESRYWSFGLRNYQGADFSMDNLVILYDLKTKKV